MNPYKKLIFILCCFATVLMASQSYAAIEIEPNNTMAQANALTPGVPMTGQLSSYTDKDYFKFAVNGPGVVSLQFGYSTPPNFSSWTVSIIDGAGNTLTSASISSFGVCPCQKQLQAGVGSVGIYYVLVNGSMQDNYTLTVTGDVVTAVETQPPTVPTDLGATAVNATQINLAWAASTDNVGVTAYKVYRDGVLIATLGDVTGYSSTGLTPSTVYSYTVQACDAAGNCSAQSAAMTVTTASGTQTKAPYDGIWAMTYQGTSVGYLTVQENNGTVIAVWLASDLTDWAAVMGPRNNNSVDLSTVVGHGTMRVTATFTSATTFTATQVSCVPGAGWVCLLPNGATVQGVKIW